MDLRELPARSFERHPWETMRAKFFARVLAESSSGGDLSALDVGAGDGFFAHELLRRVPALARVTCFDTAYDADWLQKHGSDDPRVSFTAHRPSEKFDRVILLDVLEHTDDDRACLRDAASNWLSPNGKILVSVPAHPRLFSRHDEKLGHRRRYTPARLRALALDSGLRVLAQGSLFPSLLLPRGLAKLGEMLGFDDRAEATSAHVETPLGNWRTMPIVSSVVKNALALDAECSRLAARWRLPLPGLSTWLWAEPA